MESVDNIIVFSGSSNPDLTQKICDYVGIPVGKTKVEPFPDGETLVKLEQEIGRASCRERV